MPAIRWFVSIVITLGLLSSAASAAPRRRGPSPEQAKKMKEEAEYRQREMQRVQRERQEKERELFDQFDENKDGRLLGAERSKYDKQREAIRTGKVPNPFATIVPAGQGPRTTAGSATQTKKK